MSTKTAELSSPPPKHLTGAQVCEHLCIHPNTLSRLIRDNEFPNCFRLIRGWRIPETDLKAYIARRQAARGLKA